MSSTVTNNKGRMGRDKIALFVMFAVGLAMALLLWRFIPRTNPRAAEPGSPYYSPPSKEEAIKMLDR